MKKSTKAIAISTVVALVIGIGAVSYAAWNVDTVASVSASGSTGSIMTIGSVTATIDKPAGKDDIEKIIPYDQSGPTKDGMTKLWTVSVKPVGVVDASTVRYYIKYTDAAPTAGAFYIYTGTDKWTSDTAPISGTIDATKWTKIIVGGASGGGSTGDTTGGGTENGVQFFIYGTGGEKLSGKDGGKAYIIFSATGVADMNYKASFTVTAVIE